MLSNTDQIQQGEFQGGILGGGAKTAEEAVRRESQLPEREMNIPAQSGKGPHIQLGRGITKMADTAGRRAALTHGSQASGTTSGKQARGQFEIAREARGQPRDALHYRQDFGMTLTDEGHADAVKGEKDFAAYTTNITGLIGQERGAIAQGTQQVQGEWQSVQSQLQSQLNAGMSSIQQQRDKAVSQLGKPLSVDQAWQQAQQSFHPMRVYSGSMSNPGKLEATYRAPVQYLQASFPELVKAGYTVINNNVYANGRGQEVHNLGVRMYSQAKSDFYKTGAKQVEYHNRELEAARRNIDSQYNTAKSNLNTQYSQSYNQVQRQYSDSMAQLAARSGAATGREQGLNKEIQSRKGELAKVRQSYQDRLARIDEAIGGSVERTASSRSEAQPIRRIDPRMPGAQQQG